MKRSSVKIGCSSAFWGDSAAGAHQLVRMDTGIHYLVADYLAEVTMGLLARSRKSTAARGGAGAGGFIAEFVRDVWKPLLTTIREKKIKIVTNAGGMNPLGLKAALEEAAAAAGVTDVRIAAVYGDDVGDRVLEWREQGHVQPFAVEQDVEALWSADGQSLMSCNAYLGAGAIRDALQAGADVVVTGRVADSALVLGPLVHEFGWRLDHDWDRLSGGSLAGHLIECGAQATGGNFTDWMLSSRKGWDNVGFPIAECFEDGSCRISKPEGTGGLVSVHTVGEQLVYEIGNPAAYILPDVVCDWTQVRLTQESDDVVRVQGARGLPATGFYKLSATVRDGWKLGGTLSIAGYDAAPKAQAVADAILTKVSRILKLRGMAPFRETNVELLGSESVYGPHSRAMETREVVLKIDVHHDDPKALAMFAMEVAPSATSMAPGITGGGSGRPRPQEFVRHHAALLPKHLVPARWIVGNLGERLWESPHYTGSGSQVSPNRVIEAAPSCPIPSAPRLPSVTVPLIDLCVARSGDKGDTANIGVLVREPSHFSWLRSELTAARVRAYMAHLLAPNAHVYCYELPGIHGLNFVLTQALGGGGISSLRNDRQGKSYAQILLSMPVTVPAAWLAQHQHRASARL